MSSPVRLAISTREESGESSKMCTTTSSPTTARAKVFTGARRRTPANRAETLFTSLVGLLETEWKGIRSFNLGVRSGTGVVDELVMRKIQQWVQELHTICISSEEASEAMGKLARKLSKRELQQLQVMFDVTDHPFLSDFIRVMVFNTSHPFASTPVDALPHEAKMGRRSTQTKASDASGPVGPLLPAGPRPGREEVLRFAGYLPETHPLVQKAYSLYLSRMPPDSPGSGNSTEEGMASELMKRAAAREYAKQYGGPSLHSAFYNDEARKSKKVDVEEQYGDIEERWKQTTHTVLKDDTMTNSIMISDSLPAWLKLPDFKVQLQQEEEAASNKAHPASQAQERHHLKASGVGNTSTRRQRTISQSGALLASTAPSAAAAAASKS